MPDRPADIHHAGGARTPAGSAPVRVEPGAAGTPGTLSLEEFGRLFESASRTLWCVAAAVTRDRARAADIVQEAAVIAMGKRADFNPATSFTAWMAQIVRYTAYNEGRRAARERAALARAADEPRAGVDHAVPNDAERAVEERLGRALDELDDTARACLVLRVVAQLSYRQIAEALDVPEGTAMSHVFRARKHLRLRLETGPGTPPGALRAALWALFGGEP